MNTNCTHLWSLGHPLHTHRQAHVRLSKTPTSGRLDMPKSCGKFESGYKKHAYNSWGCLAFLTRSGWSPPHEFANGPYSANCTAAQLRLRNGYCLTCSPAPLCHVEFRTRARCGVILGSIPIAVCDLGPLVGLFLPTSQRKSHFRPPSPLRACERLGSMSRTKNWG